MNNTSKFLLAALVGVGMWIGVQQMNSPKAKPKPAPAACDATASGGG